MPFCLFQGMSGPLTVKGNKNKVKHTITRVRLIKCKSQLCDHEQVISFSVPHVLTCKMKHRVVSPLRIIAMIKDHPLWLLEPGVTLLLLVLLF